MNNTQQRLNNDTSKNSVNTDTFLKINLESKNTILPTNEINRVINVAERFNVERQRCTYYRIIGTLNPLVSNPLFNLSNNLLLDKFTWSGFNSLDFLDYSYPQDGDVNDDGDLTYSKAIDKHLKEKDGWFGYFDPIITGAALCNYFDIEPKRQRFSFLPDINPFMSNLQIQPVKNWEISVTYPKSIDKTHKMVNGGLLILETQSVEVSTKLMTALTTGVRHNLSIGETVRIIGTNGYDGDHTVISLGLNNGDYKDFYFVIDVPNTGTINNNSRMKRLVNNVESEYYFRKFRKIKTKQSQFIESDDYETYQAGFSENAFNDEIIQFVFNEDIDVNELTDNLGRPLSEIYVTIIKTDSNGLFTNVSSGIETPFVDRLNTSNNVTYLRDIPAIGKIHNGGNFPFPTHTPLEVNVTIDNNNNFPNNNEFYGDLVEYNKNTLRETILSVISHRFNTLNRESLSPLNYVTSPSTTPSGSPITTSINLGPRQEGYVYQPHYQIKIREFSNYIEEGDAATEGIPNYAIENEDGKFIWRDLLDIGFNDSEENTLDYPFLNGVHYLYQNYCFMVRRQDQFALWGLYYSKFPADPVGERITDKFIVKTANQDVC
jgi:hypothetical protein